MSSSDVDIRMNAMVAPLDTELETLIQPVRQLEKRSSNDSTSYPQNPVSGTDIMANFNNYRKSKLSKR